VIFRVPRDYTGGSVGCPSCEMQLRLPLRMKRPSADSALAREAREAGAALETKIARRNARRALVGVLGLLVAGATGLLVFEGGGQGAVEVAAGAPRAEVVGAAEAAAPAAAAPEEGAADSFEATVARASEIEAVGVERVRQFLAAGTAEDYAPLVRDPDVALPRIREFLLANPPRALELRSLKVSLAPGGRYLADLTLEDFSTKRMILEDTRDGVRIDWEAWVGWSSMPWGKFKETKPTVGQEFRVTATPVSYYNYEFADEERWSAWMLAAPQGEEFLYGYVARNSPAEAELISLGKRSAGAMTLRLAFPPNATTNNLCEITEVLAAGWAGQSPPATPAPSKP